MHFFITGAAGFVGSNVVDRLLADGHHVIGYDNLSTGHPEFLENARVSPHFRFVEGDTLDRERLAKEMVGSDIVFHFAANADVRHGTEHPEKDLHQNTIATSNVLDAMRETGVSKIAFTSTGSVYGEPNVFPTPETAPFPVQTSFYGAAKLAGEGLVQAYCEGFGFTGWIFRFVSILGERYTHGHVYDFYQKLLTDPDHLEILGDGHQTKSYLYVQDCIDAMLAAIERAKGKVNIFNLGTDTTIEVIDSIRWITETMGVCPELSFAGGKRGWIGDSPMIHLDCSRIRSFGWVPKLTIEEGVIRTLRWLQENDWVLEAEQ